MSQIDLTLPDGRVLSVASGTPFREVVGGLGEGLLRSALAVSVEGENFTLADLAERPGRFTVITRGTDAGLDALRHSSAHLLAWAVQELFPGVKFAFGPAIETGFYYDFDRDEPFTEQDLAAIEGKMWELGGTKVPVERRVVTAQEGRRLFADQPYKLEQIEHLQDATLSVYRMGAFQDLCEGPHVPSTADLRVFKLLSVAGAYWRGDSRNRMLQRIYGTAFFKQKELDEHLAMLEEAKRRDHRKLGRDLDLFGVMPEAGPGLSYWFPRGDIIRDEIMTYWKRLHRDHAQIMESRRRSAG
jgi:threonyl-tRNA synthetase